MIEFGFAKPKRCEKGFTLIELLVVLAILSAIMTTMSAAVIIIMKTVAQNEEWNVNIRQVQDAGHWISQDALMAQVVDTTKPGVFLSLSWSDWNGDSYNIDYVFEDNRLMRQLNGSSSILVAEYLVPAFTTCDFNTAENQLTVTIRASLYGDQGRYLERTYEISPRPALRGG